MPCRKFCSSPRAATPPSGLATNTSPCHFLSRGTPFRPFETAASTRSRPAATFHAPARASPPASKRSPNSSIPPLKFRARPEQPSCQSPRKRAPPAPPRFSLSPWTFASGHLFQRPVDNSRFIYKTLICKGEPHDRNRNQTRHRGTCGSQRSRTRLSPRLRNGAPHRAANQRRAALHPRRPLPHALPHGTARLDSRCLGNQQQRPAEALLSPHGCGKENAIAAPPGMVGAFPSIAPAQEGVPCLIGKKSWANSSQVSHWTPQTSAKCTQNLPPTSKKLTKLCSEKA